jgi:site-specific recombinase XerD
MQEQSDLPDYLSSTLKPKQQCDYVACSDFLLSYEGSCATFNAYRRELERFMQWLWASDAQSSLATTSRKMIESYIAFCQSPPPDWVMTQQTPRFTVKSGQRQPNPKWRPFMRPRDQTLVMNTQLSEKSVQAMLAVLSSFFQFLVQSQYLSQNPVLQIRQKSKYIKQYQHQAPVRRLSELQWSYVIETAELMANQQPHQHERTLFIMSVLYGLYLRISELAASARWVPLMSHFKQDHDGNWWFHTLGKGNKLRDISVSNDVIRALKRYRKHLGLPNLPTLNEQYPLICKLEGRGAVTSTRQIRNIVQQCFDQSMQRLRADDFTEDAEQLNAATVHWLRHTGISEDVKIRPREHVRDDAGHSSSITTDRYIDIEKRARHASAKNKKINDV